MDKDRDVKSSGTRLTKAERRHQLLETSLSIVRAEGADRLTLGRLAERAGVSKPVAYEHFGTRSGLLIELYKTIDLRQASLLREALSRQPLSLEETVDRLAGAYIHCSADTSGEWHIVGAALSGNPEMDTVRQELIEEYVQLFATVLAPYSRVDNAELRRCCVGLVGAGEALSVMMVRGDCSEMEAARSFATLIRRGIADDDVQKR